LAKKQLEEKRAQAKYLREQRDVSYSASAAVNILRMYHILAVSGLMLLFGQQEGHPACKNFAPKPLAIVVDISGWGTGCSSLWQPHLPVNATNGATGLPGFTWKMVVKTANYELTPSSVCHQQKPFADIINVKLDDMKLFYQTD